MAEGFITRKGGVSGTKTPTISLVSKDTESITFTITNNDTATADIFWEVGDDTPDANQLLLAGETTSGNITASGLDDDTEYTIFTFANAAGKAGSATASLTVTTEPLYYLSFDGVDDYIILDNTISDISKNNNFSIEIDFKMNNINDNQHIFASTNSSSDRFAIRVVNGGIDIGIYNGSSWFVSNSGSINLNVEYNLKVSFINGNLTSTLNNNALTGNDTPFAAVTNNTVIGANTSINNFANIDIYNLTIYNDNFNTKIHEYLINEGSGTTLTDSVGNNNGTINGATWEQG